MKDELVTFETAKLAKEKGFSPGILVGSHHYFYKPDGTRLWGDSFGKENFYYVSTQSLLQRWLREVHNIEVPVIFFDRGYLYTVTKKPSKGNHYRVEYSETYEEALEKGLFEALDLLPNV